ncbi:MAG: hypothetical protein ACYDHM_16695 [Acidiferrobacterales bacterium]
MACVKGIRWIALGVAIAGLGACATAGFSPPPPAGARAMAVQLKAYEPGSSDVPLGAKRVAHSPFAIIASKPTPGAAGFGLLGALYAQHEGSSASHRVMAGHESALHLDLAGMTKRELLSASFHPRWAPAGTTPANRLEIRPYAILQSEDGVHAQVYVVLKTALVRRGHVEWATRYIAQAPGELRLKGPHAWFQHGSAALRTAVLGADREAVRILLRDLKAGGVDGNARPATITGILPGVARPLTVPALIRTHTARRIVFTPKLPTFSVMYGVLSLPADAVVVKAGS